MWLKSSKLWLWNTAFILLGVSYMLDILSLKRRSPLKDFFLIPLIYITCNYSVGNDQGEIWNVALVYRKEAWVENTAAGQE